MLICPSKSSYGFDQESQTILALLRMTKLFGILVRKQYAFLCFLIGFILIEL